MEKNMIIYNNNEFNRNNFKWHIRWDVTTHLTSLSTAFEG